MFYDKLVLLCNQNNTSPSAVAADIGLSNSAATKWKRGAEPQTTTIQKIASYFNVSANYFAPEEASEGGGEDYDVEAEARKLAAKLGMISRRTQESKHTRNKIKPKKSFVIEVPVVRVPVYESASAGLGVLARNEVVGYAPCILPANVRDEYIGIKVQGDSMYPKIEDGDTVIVHKQTSVDSGAIAVVLVDGEEGFVKKVEYGPDWINLVSINPMYPPMRFRGEEVTRVSVQGRVIQVIKDV